MARSLTPPPRPCWGRQGQDTARLRDINDLLGGGRAQGQGQGQGQGQEGGGKGSARRPSVDFSGLVAGALASVRGADHPLPGAQASEEKDGLGGAVRFTLSGDDEHPPSPDKHGRAARTFDDAESSGQGNSSSSGLSGQGQGQGQHHGDSAEAFFEGRKAGLGQGRPAPADDPFFHLNELARAAATGSLGLSPGQLEEANKLAQVGRGAGRGGGG